MQAESLQAIVEAMIFISEKPLSFKQLQGLLEDVSLLELQEVMDRIKHAYQMGHHGIYLESVGGGYQFRTKIDKAHWLRKLSLEKPMKLTRSQLETLAIVAYRQPITRIDVDLIRGVDSTHLLKILLDKKLIRILGVKESPGRPIIYGTTSEFLEFFNLSGMDALPRLEDLKELKADDTPTLPLFKSD